MRESTAFNSVDDYIAAAPEDVQPILQKIRGIVQKAAPGAEEAISYGLPAYKLHGALVYFGAFKHHIGFYPPVAGDEALLKEAAPYAGEKGNLKFPLDRAIPYKLIEKLVKQRVLENIARAEARAGKKQAKRVPK